MYLLPATYEDIALYIFGYGFILSAFFLIFIMIFNFPLADKIITKAANNAGWSLIAYLSICIGLGIIQAFINATVEYGVEKKYESILIVDYINWLVTTFG